MWTVFLLVVSISAIGFVAAYLTIERPTNFTEFQRGNMSEEPRDDWHKPRGAKNLTAEEMAKIRVAYNCGRKPKDIARELQCASRTAAKYYGQFRDEGRRRRMTEAAKPASAPQAPKSRFYKSNFELCDD